MGSIPKNTKLVIGHKDFASDSMYYKGANGYSNAGGTDFSSYGTATAGVLAGLNNLIHPTPPPVAAPVYTPLANTGRTESTGLSAMAITGIALGSAAALGLIIWGIYKVSKG